MKCFVLFCFLVVSGGDAAVTSCASSADFFVRYNSSADDGNRPGPKCGGQCCGRGREDMLEAALHQAAVSRVTSATKPIVELLLTTRKSLQDHFMALSHQSQNKTASLLSQVYRGHETRAHAPLAIIYNDIRTMLRFNFELSIDEESADKPPKDLLSSARQFFRDLFPVAYQNVLRLDGKRFAPEYEVCLKDAYEVVQPFGDIPQRVGQSLTRSLEAARTLLQVLAIGAGALATSEQVLSATSQHCSSKFLRASGCPRCRGLDVRPCKKYCLNVARGCLGSLVSDLDGPWAGYVEAVERMTRPEADPVLRTLDEKVSNAIMHALENHVILENKVRQECGPPSTMNNTGITTPRPTPGSSRRDSLRSPPPDAQLLQFAATLASNKKIFVNIADRMCEKQDFSQEDGEECWNGEEVGVYSKALVASSSLTDQRYNPELSSSAVEDERVADIGNKLRKSSQRLLSHTWDGLPAAEAFMQGDEAGDEGSGSGKSYTDDDAAYDAEGSGEEGSGVHEIMHRNFDLGQNTYSSTPRTSAATTTKPISAITLLILVKFCLT